VAGVSFRYAVVGALIGAAVGVLPAGAGGILNPCWWAPRGRRLAR
jgi:hypothetical protein